MVPARVRRCLAVPSWREKKVGLDTSWATKVVN